MGETPDYPSREHRITLDLTPELAERLKIYRKKYKKEPPIAHVVRTALDKFLPKLKKEEDSE